MSAPLAVVIGVGNEYRCDDGVGAAVIERLGQCDLPGVRLVIADGEPSQLIDAWSDVELAVVVDAVLCEPCTPGRVHRTTLDTLVTDHRSASTHALGIPDAVRLAEALGRGPRRLVVFAVEAADLGFGLGLSPEVERSVASVADAVLAELRPVAGSEGIEIAARPEETTP